MLHIVRQPSAKTTCRSDVQQQTYAPVIYRVPVKCIVQHSARCRFRVPAQRLRPLMVSGATATWKANLQRVSDSGYLASRGCLTLWTRLAGVFREGNTAAVNKALLGLSSLAPEHLYNHNLHQGSQRQPSSKLGTGSAHTKQASNMHTLQSATLAAVLMCPEERSAREEILLMLLTLLESASGAQKLLVAASLYSCVTSSQAYLPHGALTARHLSIIIASLECTPASSSAQSANTYLLATLQCTLASAPHHKHSLIAAAATPLLVHLVSLDQLMQSTSWRSHDGVSNELQHLLIGAGIRVESCETVTAAALGVLSQLLISGRAADSEVVHQMLEADAVPMLVSLLGAHAKAADLLCILAKEQQCKEAFLEQAALQSLVTCLQGDVSGGAAAAGEAAAVLWRVATDCDKAKLEVAKAGAVAPAVALLQAANRDAAFIPAATEAAYLLAELAEHPCTHQLITQYGSIAALLQVMHSTCQARTTSQTLDSASATPPSQLSQLRQGITSGVNGVSSVSRKVPSGRSALTGTKPSLAGGSFPLDRSESAGADDAQEVWKVSAAVDEYTGGTTAALVDSAAPCEGIEEGWAAATAGANDLRSGAAEPGDLAGSTASAADTAMPAGMASTEDSSTLPAENGNSIHALGQSEATLADHSMHSARSSISSSSNADCADGQRADVSSSSGSGSSSDAVRSRARVSGVSSTSIHSRLLQAARAAKSYQASCSIADSPTVISSGGASDKGPGSEHATLMRDRLLVAANAALVSLTGNPDTHFGIVNEGAAPALVATLQHGTVNAQALACNAMHALAASEPCHGAVFARAGAIPWLVGLIHQWPSHTCSRNAALTLRELLQNPDYQSEACACGAIPALVAMLKGENTECQSAAAALLHTLAAATHISRKKAISRSGGIPALVAVLSGSCAEGSMHAAQGLLHMAKLPDLKVLVVQGEAVASAVHHLNTTFRSCSCQANQGQSTVCYCACSQSATARLLGRLCSDQVAQMQIMRHNPVAALLHMLTGGCKSPVLYHDLEGNEVRPLCQKSRFLLESGAEYALLRIACHCDEEFREQMLHACIGQVWMGHDIPVALMLL